MSFLGHWKPQKNKYSSTKGAMNCSCISHCATLMSLFDAGCVFPCREMAPRKVWLNQKNKKSHTSCQQTIDSTCGCAFATCVFLLFFLGGTGKSLDNQKDVRAKVCQGLGQQIMERRMQIIGPLVVHWLS